MNKIISNKTIFQFSGFALFLLTLARVSFAADYYVSPTGTATWVNCGGAIPLNGTSACSWQTAMSSATAGDIVYFRGGDYNPGDAPNAGCGADSCAAMTPLNSGIESHPITFIAYPGETPVIIGNPLGAVFGAYHNNYIVWDGFSSTMVQFHDPSQPSSHVNKLFAISYSDHVTIRNSNLTGIRSRWGQNSGLVYLMNSNNVLIENNKLHDNNGYLATDPEYINFAGNTAAIFFESTYAIVKNNDIYNNIIGIYEKYDGHSPYWGGTFYGSSVFYNNHIWGTGLYSSGYTGCWVGIMFHTQNNGDLFFQNIIRNCYEAVHLGDNANTTVNHRIYNNTIYNDASIGRVAINNNIYSRNIEVFNNIISNPYEHLLRYYSGLSMPAYSDYNNFHMAAPLWRLDLLNYSTLSSWTTATGFDSNSIISNPLFISAGGLATEDYKLQSNSPAVGAGIDRQDYDNDGNATERINIGAYITGNEVIGYQTPDIQNPPDTAPPVRPKGLKIRSK